RFRRRAPARRSAWLYSFLYASSSSTRRRSSSLDSRSIDLDEEIRLTVHFQCFSSDWRRGRRCRSDLLSYQIRIAGGDCLAGLGISEAVPDGRRIPENWYWYVCQIGRGALALKDSPWCLRRASAEMYIAIAFVSQPALSSRGHWFLRSDGPYGVDDVAGGDPE